MVALARLCAVAAAAGLLPAAVPSARSVSPAPADPRFAVLANGVRMPRVLLGMGPWCNDPIRCPAPAKPCHDCYNDSSAAADIALAFSKGFAGIDTALGYGSQAGVGAAVRALPSRAAVFLQTKVPGCNGAPATCAAKTTADVEKDLQMLGLSYVDSVLLHGPPGPHGAACQSAAVSPNSLCPRRCVPLADGAGAAGQSCAAAVAQWGALEKLYAENKTRAIGETLGAPSSPPPPTSFWHPSD